MSESEPWALAFGSGSLRGAAHIGVLKVLREENLEPDILTGTSVGSIAAILVAQGLSVDSMRRIVMEIQPDNLFPGNLNRWQLLRTGGRIVWESLLRAGQSTRDAIVTGSQLERWIETHCPVDRFDEFDRPTAAVAADIHTGKTVIFTGASHWEQRPEAALDQPGYAEVISDVSPAAAARASSSIPYLFSPKLLKGHALVDGAAVEPVPVQTARLLGAKTVVAVDLSSGGPLPDPVHGAARILIRYGKVAERRMSDLQIKRHADVIIRPKVAGIGLLDFERIPWCIHQGELAARNIIHSLKQRLG